MVSPATLARRNNKSRRRPKLIIDADAHVIEPNAIWANGVPERWKAQAPATIEVPALDWRPIRGMRWLIELEAASRAHGRSSEELAREVPIRLRQLGYAGEPVWRDVPENVWKQGTIHTLRHHFEAARRGFEPAAYVEALDRLEVDRAHLYPTAALWVLAIDAMDPELASALSRAYNDWLADFCDHAPARLRPVAALSLHNPDAAAAEVERIAARGWTAAMIRPNPSCGRPLGHPLNAPVFAACERHQVALAIHEGSHARQTTVGWERFSTRLARHACSHPLEHMMAFASLFEAGVFDRHPTLRIALLEAGCSWLPYWLWRMDQEFEQLGWELAGRQETRPSDCFRRQCWIGCEPDEPGLEQVVDGLGADRLLYGSDYPHIDHEAAVARDVDTLVDRLGPTAAQQILGDNPSSFYRDPA
ncbi:MAG: amidohydrolase [Myxococcales bacterium]|nr:amidohydrolase [Myxococcales bacterium]